MEQHKLTRMGFTLSIVASCIIAVVIVEYGRRRRKSKVSKKSCYLVDQVKPQSHFKRVLADNSYSSFKHLSINDISSNSHPYEQEIKTLLQNPEVKADIFDKIVMTRMNSSHVWVESESQLRQLVDVLSHQKVFAVDTEQHSLRSFLGFTALVQISTEKEDYLVDTIALHDVMDILRSVFANPSILKVFHGADNDVLWLQRDFHIYLVNLFDTAKACELLSKPQKSLAYLLESYCGVSTNKLFQREDWRQRPLPEEMVDYAQSDAHYLLYIAKCLIEELTAKDNSTDEPKIFAHQDDKNQLLLEASRRSNTTCLQLYWKEDESFPGENVASSILARNSACGGVSSPKSCEEQFQNHIRKLCAWRDLMARVHDESLRYVLSDQAIIALADKIPSSERDVYNTIFKADQENDSSSSLMSPSPIICSHWDDVQCLLKDVHINRDNFLQGLLQKHLGPCGTCSLSIFNYSLLSKSNLKFANGTFALQSRVKNGKFTPRKSSRDLFVQKFSCKAPVYHNCRIYANDGRLLCYCDRRKLEWYLNRQLAELIDDDPPAITLLFEPKGRPEDEGNDFYIQSKRNLCVGCGETKHYLRYRIIPSCYRMHFPEHLKSHRSHDIVLLCVDCHEVAHAAAEKYKRHIAAEFGIPLYVRKMVDSGQQLVERPEMGEHDEAGVSPLQLRIAAMALLRHGPRMPFNRRDELMEILKTYYGGREITSEDLENALLVGMSARGRRKFQKKKGAARKKSPVAIFLDQVQEDTKEDTAASINIDLEESNRLNKSLNIEDEASYRHLSDKSEADVSSLSQSSELENSENVSAVGATPVAVAGSESLEIEDVTLSDAGNTLETDERGSNIGPLNLYSKKGRSKASLLGHGPHGKEVVDYLLKKYGDDGVQQFCQRWRRVFVDALHPRYLPAGWDVKHSGRRDFGEFSVYNPTKKPSGETQ
ncbi:protein RRP6-like 3 [Silene latifolia]|uniref:protein RRP6-like 3 n=1 Tax=Silene latifolia TaxID=37657 RepID=UPI003D783BAD